MAMLQETTGALQYNDYLRLLCLHLLWYMPEPQLPDVYLKIRSAHNVDEVASQTDPQSALQPNLTQPAREVLLAISDAIVREYARTVLDLLESQIGQILNVEQLPFVRAIEADDRSLLIEWIFFHFRIGFSIEPDNAESSWYLVSDSSTGSIQAAGYLRDSNLEQLISWLVNYVAQSNLTVNGFSR
jgi:hypothetical protein